MENNNNYSFKDFLPVFLILSITGLVGLVLVIFVFLPYLGPRWLFFFFGVMAISGIAIPIAYYLNRRFASDSPAEKNVIIRQALWFGIYGATISWLQMGRVLNSGMAFILAAAFILIEVLLRLWERSHWKPKEPQS